MSKDSVVLVPKLQEAPGTDFASLSRDFLRSPTLHMELASVNPPSPEQPEAVRTQIRLGWTPEALWVHAVMEDHHIHNQATKLNDDTWALGDVFEVFIRNTETTRYWEIHVTPENQKLQLLWPHKESIYEAREAKLGLTPFYDWNPVFESWTIVKSEENSWEVLCKLPATLLYGENEPIVAGKQWFFSFCRYDYDPNKSKPNLYSTTQYSKLNFHLMEDWRKLEFSDVTGLC